MITSNGIAFTLQECLDYDLPIDNLQDSLEECLNASNDELREEIEVAIDDNYVSREVIFNLRLQVHKLQDLTAHLKDDEYTELMDLIADMDNDLSYL